LAYHSGYKVIQATFVLPNNSINLPSNWAISSSWVSDKMESGLPYRYFVGNAIKLSASSGNVTASLDEFVYSAINSPTAFPTVSRTFNNSPIAIIIDTSIY